MLEVKECVEKQKALRCDTEGLFETHVFKMSNHSHTGITAASANRSGQQQHAAN